MKFETYDDMCAWMNKRGRKGNLSLVRDELERAVEEEAEALALAHSDARKPDSGARFCSNAETDAPADAVAVAAALTKSYGHAL